MANVQVGIPGVAPDLETWDPHYEFAQWWKAYPKKVGKLAAEKAWHKRKCRLEPCLAALAWQIKSRGWCKDYGAFVPNPATYLNEGRWLDEQPKAPPAARPRPQIEGSPYCHDHYLGQRIGVKSSHRQDGCPECERLKVLSVAAAEAEAAVRAAIAPWPGRIG